MEQIAIISDIHGNLPALEAVLEDIRQRQIERIYCLGDLVGKGPDSAAVIDLCRDVCTATVRGNWDETMVDEERGTSAHWQWNRERLGHTRLTYLRNLPFAVDFLISGRRVRLFHASPQSVHHRVSFRHDFQRLRDMFLNTDATGHEQPPPAIVGYGDIHHPYLLPVDRGMLFNVGSVGNSLDYCTLAGYAILRGEWESTVEGPLGIEIVRVPYDIERALAIARAVTMPKYAEYEFELRTADHRSQMP
ncbi:MAG: metallophosphoesterase family protein [Caldilineaceae bacterium]|nr:metallophosphoesterase family protein [Caldilineaceae bacterium]